MRLSSIQIQLNQYNKFYKASFGLVGQPDETGTVIIELTQFSCQCNWKLELSLAKWFMMYLFVQANNRKKTHFLKSGPNIPAMALIGLRIPTERKFWTVLFLSSVKLNFYPNWFVWIKLKTQDALNFLQPPILYSSIPLFSEFHYLVNP